MNNGRFVIAMHILILLDHAKDKLVSSSDIAESININPAMVRKELINLRNHGFVQSKEGKNGGTSLLMDASKITLGAIYESVRQVSFLGNQKNQPNPECLIGKNINKHLAKLYSETEQVLIDELSKQTLKNFGKKFKK